MLRIPRPPCDLADVTLPVTVYDHSRGRCVIVGGAVSHGVFFYADFCSGSIWGLQRTGDEWQSTLLIDGSFLISGIGADVLGYLYVAGYSDGVIYRLGPTFEEEDSGQDTAGKMNQP